MQAGVALRMLDRRPGPCPGGPGGHPAASREALDDLRAEVDALRARVRFRRPTPLGAPRPASAADCPRSPSASVPAGYRSMSRSDGAGGLPGADAAPVDLAAYRIVQESLTNVLRHAGRATAAVRVSHPRTPW